MQGSADAGKSKGIGTALVVVPILLVLAMGAFFASAYLERKNHVAPISEGAIPDRIGCDVGCEKLNNFSGWQPYLQRVAEVARRDFKCKRVDYVNVSSDSVIPDNPEFSVVCDGEFKEPGKDGKAYVTSHFKTVIDIQYRKLDL